MNSFLFLLSLSIQFVCAEQTDPVEAYRERTHGQRRLVITGVGGINSIGNSHDEIMKSLFEGKVGIDAIDPKTLPEGFDPKNFDAGIAGQIKGQPFTNIRNYGPGIKKPTGIGESDKLVIIAGHEALIQSKLLAQDGKNFTTHFDPHRTLVLVGRGTGDMGVTERSLLSLKEHFARFKDIPPDVLKRIEERLGPQLGSEVIGVIQEAYDGLPRKYAKDANVDPMGLVLGISNMSAGHLTRLYGIHGPSFCTSSACGSGATAVALASMMVQNGLADVALVGGGEVPDTIMSLGGFGKLGVLSMRNHDPKGASRPFDKERDGFVLGSGATMFVIETEEHALKRGAKWKLGPGDLDQNGKPKVPQMFAYVAGYGMSSDASGVADPDPAGQAIAHRLAFGMAGINPRSLREQFHYQAHGTATKLGDVAEMKAAHDVFGDLFIEQAIVGAIKGNTGHMIGNAGTAGIAAALGALQHQKVPGIANLHEPSRAGIDDPDLMIKIASGEQIHYPMHRQAFARIVPVCAKIRLALTGSFGFGGQNNSVLLIRP